MANNLNGRGGVKWTTIIPIAVLIIGGGATWGETRLTTATNAADIQEIEETHSADMKILRDTQEKFDDKLDKVITEQAVTAKEIENIQESQKRQEEMSKQILRALQQGNGQ